MSVPSRLRIRAQAGVVLLVCIVQGPLVASSAYFSWWLALGVAVFGAFVSLPVIGQLLRSPWDHKPRSALHKYLVMWPFYSWWTLSLMFALTAPPLLLLGGLTPLTTAQALLIALGLGFVGAFRALRPRAHVAKRRLPLSRLAAPFDGFKIVQLSDIHCGPFTPARLVGKWVARANALKPDLIVVTGDLITTGSDYIEEMAAALGKLQAPCGVLACLGNHDYFGTGGAVGPALQRHGINVLNNRGITLQRQGESLYVAGVDDNWSGRDDLPRALRERPALAATVLLAHDPNLFHKAIAAQVDLTLSGHTHGGQFAVPWMVRRFNLARMVTPFTSGLYRHRQSLLYVNHGLGTSGPPIRLGARPELALLTLVRDESGKGESFVPLTTAQRASVDVEVHG
ncbi:MAG: metallophosphoesterase [Deltaproteobacteria bacterium]|nr:metallophosphoesterase [Deltaproteobacteria bacterium]